MKKVLVAVLVVILAIGVAACAPAQNAAPASEAPASAAAPASEAPASEAPASAAPAESASAEASADAPATDKTELNVSLLIPSTESEYWNNYVAVGVENACLDLEQETGMKINYELSGPATEAETDAYITALESVIAKKPDVLIMATIQPQAVVPYVQKAHDQGILVNLVSLPIEGPAENYGALYYCDMVEQGEKAGELMVEAIKAKNLPQDGTIGVHMSVTIDVMEQKIEKFKEIVLAAYPDMKILDTLYNENDLNKAIANVENQLTSYGDELIGFFGNNNVSSNGICKVVEDNGLSDKMAAIASDSDAMTIDAVRKNIIDAVVVQTPYQQGYDAVKGAYAVVVEGKTIEKDVNIPCVALKSDNVDSEEYKSLIDATSLKRN